MRVLLISANTETMNMPVWPMGLGAVAVATRRAGHEVEMLADEGIRQIGFLLLGGLGETKASVEESLAFVDSLRLDAVKITVGIRIYPHTALAASASREGVVSPHDDLLFPKFFLTPDLADWLSKTIGEWAGSRPHWIV